MDNNLYGQTQSEKIATENKIARQIVSEINQFGINDRQRWLILYQLSLELENVEDMKSMTAHIKELKGNQVFISRIYGGEENEGEV
jgi:hypothetical protein